MNIATPVKAGARKEQRRKARQVSRTKFRCRLKRATEEGSWMATIQNISAEGIGLVANRPFKRGMTLTLELPTAGVQTSKSVLITVCHAEAQPGGRFWALGGTFSRPLTKEEVDALRSRSPSIVPHSERRTNVRHTTRVKNPCPVIRVAEDGPWFATIRNVSEDGIGLISNRPFRVGVLLTVELPDRLGQLSKPRLLRVTHVRAQEGKQWWVLGGAFLSRLTVEEVNGLL